MVQSPLDHHANQRRGVKNDEMNALTKVDKSAKIGQGYFQPEFDFRTRKAKGKFQLY
jgi:hypothetical protein